jgi:hypothetical protein
MEIKFYSDSSHGWAEVPINLITELGIADKISRYSYMRGEMAYLEEDADLSVFLMALASKGVTPKFVEVWTNNDSPVRRYQSFKLSGDLNA